MRPSRALAMQAQAAQAQAEKVADLESRLADIEAKIDVLLEVVKAGEGGSKGRGKGKADNAANQNEKECEG